MDTYEKKYKEALELARVIAFNGHQSLMEGIFPELKESEDERIRKAIIEYLRQRLDRSPSIPAAIGSWLAWLEKQDKSSDQIHYWTEEEIEPIISDYLRGAEHYGGMIGRLRCLKPKSLEKQGNSPIKWNKNTEGNKPQVNHSVLMKTFQGIAEGEWKGEYWEQYRWAGIVRDSDVLSWMELSDLEKQGEKKHDWSEKDEKEYKYVLKFVDNILNNCGNKKDYEHCKRCYDWLKSLRPQPKQEWSEEDEKIFVNLISYGSLKYTGEQVIDWLKSLRQRIGG